MPDEKKIRAKFEQITRFLIEKQISITCMESCTSGQIASLLTDMEGASAIFKGSLVTYSNSTKEKFGVPVGIIDRYGVYSNETAEEMAKAACRAFQAVVGIGVTGTFGNVDPDNPDSCTGRIFFSIVYRQKIHTFSAQIPAQTSRFAYKLYAAELVADQLMELLQI